MKRGLLVLAMLTLGARGPQADAEPVGGTDPNTSTEREEVLGTETPYQLSDTIIITANRFGLKREKLIWPVNVINHLQMESQGSLESVLDGAAGVDIRQSAGEGSLSTLSNWGLFNRHMLLLYDGRVVRDYSLGGFNLADYSNDEFERIELIKGPQSAFYGADAVGGVINLISRASLVDRLTLSSRVGSNDLQQYRVDIARSTGRAGMGGFAEYMTADNVRDNSGVSRVLLGLRADYLSPDDRHHVSVAGRYFEDSLGVPGPEPGPAFVPVHGSRGSNSLYDHQKDDNYSIDARYRFHDENAGEGHLDLFWEKKNLDYNSLYNFPAFYYTPDGMGDSSLNVDSVDVYSSSIINKRSSGISGRFTRKLTGWGVAAGMDWFSGSIRGTQDDSTRGTNIVGPNSPFEYRSDAYSFWSGRQNQFDLWSAVTADPRRSLRLDLSGRLQFVRYRTTQPSYNLGLSVVPMTGLAVKAGYGYAFRLPTIAEQFADGFFTRGNRDLSPETSRSLIGTVEFVSGSGNVQASATVFRQSVDSLIQYRFDPTVFKSSPVNVERFRSKGIDIAFRLQPGEWAQLGWSLVYQKAEQTTDGGKRFIDAFYVPDVKWRLDVGGSLRAQVRYGISMTYTSERSIVMFGGSPKTIDRVYEMSASLTFHLDSHLKLLLAGHDLTNQKRPDQFGFAPDDGDYPSLGRRFSAKFVIQAL